MSLALAGACVALSFSPAAAQDGALSALGRRAALLNIADQLCGGFYEVDTAAAERRAFRLSTEGVKRYGADRFRSALSDGTAALLAEVRDGGAATWCPRYRDSLRRAGVSDVIGGPAL